jgi:hypothetical protein
MKISFRDTAILFFCLLVIVSIAIYLFLFNFHQQVKLTELRERKQEEQTDKLLMLEIPELYSELEWSQVTDIESKLALIIDNIDFVEKKEDVIQKYINLSGIEYISQPIFEKDKLFEEKLTSKVNEYFWNEFDKKRFQEIITIPNYKITLRGIVADSLTESIVGFVKYNADEVRVIVFQEEQVINSECQIKNIDMWNISDYPECYFGDQFKIFISNVVNIKYILPNQFFQIANNKCLRENELVSYEIKKEKTSGGEGIAIITIKDKNSQRAQFQSQIDILQINHYHPVELHKCGIYAARSFNYDYNSRKTSAGYRAELWKYDYRGNGEKVVLLDEDILGGLKGYKYFFSSDFRIDKKEDFIVLIRNYPDKDDYALIIKDLNTKEDIFVFPMKEIAEQYPNIVGNFGLDQWTDDSRYFWGDIFDGAYVNGYFRIDTQNWKTDIYEVPDGAMGGSPLNINTGYLPIQPGQIWTGDYQLTEELKEQYRKEGKKSQLYLYSLFTKEKTLIETTDEPLFWFKSEWLSDTELQYELPNGGKKVYNINK